MNSFTLVEKSVNSKRLADIIKLYIEEGLVDPQINWSNEIHRDSFVQVINEFFEHISEHNLILQWKVTCDHRNNTTKDIAQGIYNIYLRYQQKNCLNNTQLEYRLQVNKGGRRLVRSP